ncbi:hypothetical protein CVT26_006604 [Gymnopilus dilepis]|uniref:Mitochondrial intermembrane space import and assembly protein 40 n=1 Tax=Gymnopilus dilepis TaxID=231916 RepID=A0A409Y301_9AGAR|nr:hypothetical protein CVT26_006604 [Gymnopilus dilepis]
MLHAMHPTTPPHEKQQRRHHLHGHTRSKSETLVTSVDAPWRHMTQAYTWAAEEAMTKGTKRRFKTDDWVREQQILYNPKQSSYDLPATRTQKHRRDEWEELVYTYEIEAEQWMREEERARRVAVEREKARARIQEELRRIEARFQQKREAERREREEARQRAYAEQLEKEKRDRAKLDKLILNAWDNYEKRWTSMTTSTEPLEFRKIPWPLILPPRNTDDITQDAMVALLFSPLHSQKQTRKDRIRSAQLRWHPDRFRRHLDRVAEKDRAAVEEGVGMCSLMFSRLSRLPLRRCLHTSSAPRASGGLHRAGRIALGASTVTAAYLTWRLTSERNQIALDSPSPPTVSTQKPLATPTSQTSRPSDAPSESVASTSPSEFAPDDPSSPPSSVDESTEKEDESEPSAEGEGASGGAFNPVTGEINWDCPCLGGMAYGPCGQEFREAFSCFVYSDAEPKGINCVEKFQAMQNCFRANPEVYADEIMDDDEEEGAPTPTAGSDVPLHAESDDSKLNGQASSGVGAPQSSRIESTSASSDSS